MLDVRLTAYVIPVAEQPQASLTPTVRVQNFADEDATVTGLVRIYRVSTGLLIYSSELAVSESLHGTTQDIEALTPWDPPAPADDEYQILANITAVSHPPAEWHTTTHALGAWLFDIKTPPMGPAPAGHHVTHEDGGSDPVDVTGLSGLLADDQPALAHDIAGNKHTSTATPGQILQADANGLPVDATNTDAEVAAAVTASHPDEISDLPQTLTDQANIDWDLSLGGAAKVTLGGDRTLNAPTNMVDGARYRLKVIQDGTGTRLLTWNAIYRFPGGVHPALTAAINCIDILVFDCDGTYMDCTAMTNALS